MEGIRLACGNISVFVWVEITDTAAPVSSSILVFWPFIVSSTIIEFVVLLPKHFNGSSSSESDSLMVKVPLCACRLALPLG